MKKDISILYLHFKKKKNKLIRTLNHGGKMSMGLYSTE